MSSETCWSSPVPADATPEAQAAFDQWWLSLEPVQRVDFWFERMAAMDDVRLQLLRRRNPGASERELVALLFEMKYRDSLSPEFLAAAMEALRRA